MTDRAAVKALQAEFNWIKNRLNTTTTSLNHVLVDLDRRDVSDDDTPDPDINMGGTRTELSNSVNNTRRERLGERVGPSSGTMPIDEVRRIVVNLKKGLESIEERIPIFAKDLESLKASHASKARKHANTSHDSVEPSRGSGSQPPPSPRETRQGREPSEPQDDAMSLFTLSSETMQQGFPSCIDHLLSQGDFDGFIDLTGVGESDWAALDEMFLLNGSRLIRKARCVGTAYDARSRLSKPGTGWCFLRQLDDTNVDFPTDPVPTKRPSRAQALTWLNETINNPRQCEITYLIGPFLKHYPVPLASGGMLRDCGVKLPGINTVDIHIAKGGSGLALRCEEGALRSYHVTLLGWRAWLRINTTDNEKLESLCEKYWISDPKAERCSSWVNHLHLMLSPAWLASHGISYRLQVVGPNQMVVMEPREYYLVLNLSSCLGLSTSFLLENDVMFPDSFVTCPECALYQIGDDGNRKIDDLIKVRGARRAKTTIADERVSRNALEKVGSEIRAIEPNCQIPELRFRRPDRVPDNNTARLATLVWSRAALRQFVSLVESGAGYGQMEAKPVEGETETQRINRRIRNIDIATTNSMIGRLQKRVSEMFFAMDIQKLRKRDRAEFRHAVYETYGWTENKFKNVRARGNKWLALCKFNDTRSGLPVSPGLLCFFLMGDNPFGIHRDDYLSIQDETQQRIFVDLLKLNNYTTALLTAGNAYIGTLDGSASVRFQFEQEGREIDWQNEDQAEVISLLSVLDEGGYEDVENGEANDKEVDEDEDEDEDEDQ